MSLGDPSEVEKVLGKYQVVRPLKVGGTAAIYLAVMRGENNFRREVVIKRPLPHLVADHRARLMFIDEAHIAARLNHPNICQVLDLVSRETELYLVLEYLSGVDLREMIKRAVQRQAFIPTELVIWMAVEICAGLHFAHEATSLDGKFLGLVHRDVSPKNIRVTFQGAVKIIDFGIARAQNRATETAAGTIKGTLGYMSPEQILGDEIDRRSDIFSFGIVLFQMLTCRNPFDGPTLKERVRKLTHAPIPSVRTYNPTLDQEIEAIVARCLNRDPIERYATMQEVQVDLDRYLGRLQVTSLKQGLINYLQQIFPQHRETDPELVMALSEISQFTGTIDASKKLIFPDDPPTENHPVLSKTVDRHIGPTEVAGPSEQHTEAEDPGHTRPMRPAPRPPAEQTVPVAPSTAPAPPLPAAPDRSRQALLAVLFVLAVALTAAIYSLWNREDVVVESIPSQTKNSSGTEKQNTSAAANTSDAGSSTQKQESSQIDAGTNPSLDASTAKVAKNTSIKPKRPKTGTKSPRNYKNQQNARLFFKTARYYEKSGNQDRAILMYQLSYATAQRPSSNIFLNLGLLYRKQERLPQARACLKGYLARNPGGAVAGQVRTAIAGIGTTKVVPCVSSGDVRRALNQLQRRRAVVEGWVQQAVKESLSSGP